ncbi:MAG: glutamate--tRNA ligase [Negativicutes bacterium]|nr:glutamate--tRNA ligase [Negativicutes bacterium]
MTTDKLRVRFAPSPTGPLHIGGARSALFNWLLARQSGGQFVVRIEDTDTGRSSRSSEEDIKKALLWLGLDWDEGVDKGGEYGPYRQSERQDIYRRFTGQLLAAGQAYHCFCSEQELAGERERQLAAGQTPRYSGHCRDLPSDETGRRLAAGQPSVIRIKTPSGQQYRVNDAVRGEVVFDSDGIGDFVIVRSDGMPVYNYAVVIDDLTMRINLVVRGEEHLPNTPRQLVIYQALGAPPPGFAHVSLILGRDRSKMSKRHGATAVEQYRQRGYLPEALVNFLALLGWSPEDGGEVLSRQQLIEQFSLARVAKNPAVFDQEKLNWLNGQYFRQTEPVRVLEASAPALAAAGRQLPPAGTAEYEKLLAAVAVAREGACCGEELAAGLEVFYDRGTAVAGDAGEVLADRDRVVRVAELFLNLLPDRPDGEAVRQVLKEVVRQSGLGNRQVFMPLRVLLTGRRQGPDLDRLVPVLGRQEAEQRIRGRLDKLC